MARLLENQAKELLRETSAMAAGDVEGFAAVAFPIVRRVFGGLIANDLVSVQPMSLPVGLFSSSTSQFLTRLVEDLDMNQVNLSMVVARSSRSLVVLVFPATVQKIFYALNNGCSSQLVLKVAAGQASSGTFGGQPRSYPSR